MAKTTQTRRHFIKQLGLVALAAPVLSMAGCGSSSSDSNNSTSDNTEASGGGDAGSTTTWASGGTANMTANFPEDSLFASSAACTLALTKTLTEGPCYFATETLDDISEMQSGLPMQLCLRLIDRNCNPLPGYEIEVWHCNIAGLYSGDTSGSADSRRFSSGFCTGNNSTALRSKWFRGTQLTDSHGRVNFKTCFPGWYTGRTIHIHFRVRNNNNDQVISQFCFTDSLTAEICNFHPEYSARGTQDTTLSSGRDTVFSADYTEFLFDTRQNEDGSLLAYKTIQLN